MPAQYKPLLFIVSLVLCCALAGLVPERAAASAVQIRPLMYREALPAGSTKKGFVDISNPSAAAVELNLQVQAFRQTDGQGNLQFYASDDISRGVSLDLTEVSLGPREAVRVYFVLDSAKLPKGDVFAAIFAATRSQTTEGIMPSARVGTLLVIENGPPGPRAASIESLQVPTMNFGDAVAGAVTVKNPASAKTPSGYFPKVTLTLTPFAKLRKEISGPLVMSGVTREVEFNLAANRIGLYKLTASTGTDKASKWVFLMTGYWRWAAAGIIVLALLAAYRVRTVRSERWRAARAARAAAHARIVYRTNKKREAIGPNDPSLSAKPGTAPEMTGLYADATDVPAGPDTGPGTDTDTDLPDSRPPTDTAESSPELSAETITEEPAPASEDEPASNPDSPNDAGAIPVEAAVSKKSRAKADVHVPVQYAEGETESESSPTKSPAKPKTRAKAKPPSKPKAAAKPKKPSKPKASAALKTADTIKPGTRVRKAGSGS